MGWWIVHSKKDFDEYNSYEQRELIRNVEKAIVHHSCEDRPLDSRSAYREPILDQFLGVWTLPMEGRSGYLIRFCPWCGVELTGPGVRPWGSCAGEVGWERFKAAKERVKAMR